MRHESTTANREEPDQARHRSLQDQAGFESERQPITQAPAKLPSRILPDAFASDPERMARFARETQVLALLNHPNIAAIHGSMEPALIIELVDGKPLWRIPSRAAPTPGDGSRWRVSATPFSSPTCVACAGEPLRFAGQDGASARFVPSGRRGWRPCHPRPEVGGLNVAQAKGLAKAGLRAFVISGNMGLADSNARYNLPPAEIQRLVANFIAEVSRG